MKANQTWIKSSLLMFIGLFFTLQLSAQQGTTGNGNVIEQERNVSSFDIIKVQDGLDLFITQGASRSVMVKADENLMGQVITKVEGNTLYLEIEGSINRPKALDVYITLQDLSELHAKGGSDVYAEGGLKLDELKLFCSGGSDTKLKLEADKLYCKTSGGSDAVISGEVQTLEIECSGGSDFTAKDLRATNAKIRTNGASDAWVYVTGEVDMEASGASDIHCKGDAKVIRSKASGGSDIHY